MNSDGVDILMITYNRAVYTRLALSRLLETCDESCRVWLWHNGTDEETLRVVRSHLDHSCVFKFHHSPENKKLREPTNWLFENARGEFVSKVDDDCLVTPGWIEALRRAHDADCQIGVVGCCHFWPGDLELESCRDKIESIGDGMSLLRNCWVGGSAYLMKRACVDGNGLLGNDESWTAYCIRLAKADWKIGWPIPLVYQEHLDDPRSPHSQLRTDADLARWLPLSAQNNGVQSVAKWQAQLKRSAQVVASAPVDPNHYLGVRAKLRSFRRRLGKIMADCRLW